MRIIPLQGAGNHERLTSINDLYQGLGISLSKVPPSFHAITGCDYTPAFFRKEPLLENQNTMQNDDDIDYPGSSDDDDDYGDASVFCNTITE
ncbi:hypothetical protein TNCV_3366131 [Trichonephila clavipes]|nr:hypothetical protein TNCV_3366131 [Trichonephila clavipes]